MIVLGIETSCDETAAALVRDGREVLASCLFSQVALHRPFGGVVPEIASRHHLTTLPAMIRRALHESGLAFADVDAVAATFGPGLASSLLVGVSAARGLAWRLNRPLIAVNHIEAHLYSVFLAADAPSVDEVCPFVGLIVSGGHTLIVRVERPGRHTILGSTIDDAAGEAFDKGAHLLGLGYPGGPAIERAARDAPDPGASPPAVVFPRGVVSHRARLSPGLRAELCFSFSGLKTALRYWLKDHPLAGDRREVPWLARAYQEAIVAALADRCRRAVAEGGTLAVAGGVSLNGRLRESLRSLAAERGWRLLLAPTRYGTDNAAMIAALAGAGRLPSGAADLDAAIDPNLALAG